MTGRRFVSINAPSVEEIRKRTELMQTTEAANPDDIPVERIRINFIFRSEDNRIVFELVTLPVLFDGVTLRALVMNCLMGAADVVPNPDTFVHIEIETDGRGKTVASIPASELTFFTLE